MAQSNPLYNVLAEELSVFQNYDLHDKVTIGTLQDTGGYSEVFNGNSTETLALPSSSSGASLLPQGAKVAIKRLRYLIKSDIKTAKV